MKCVMLGNFFSYVQVGRKSPEQGHGKKIYCRDHHILIIFPKELNTNGLAYLQIILT